MATNGHLWENVPFFFFACVFLLILPNGETSTVWLSTEMDFGKRIDSEYSQWWPFVNGHKVGHKNGDTGQKRPL
jgi:hypothetical protein